MSAIEVRNLIRDNIRAIVDTFDAHDVGILQDGRYSCACKWVGPEADWYPHLAGAMGDKVAPVELPAEQLALA